MTFAARIASHRFFPLVTITVLATALRLYKLNLAFPFDHDQEVVASAAFNFFQLNDLTLIGQELSFPGFFLGPLHNWIGFIPYGLCNLAPDCVPYFYITIGVITVVLLFALISKIIGRKTALVAAIIYAVSQVTIGIERGVTSNFFLFLSQIGLFYCLWQFFKGKNQFLILGSIIAGIATVNFNPVFIFSSIAFLVTAAIKYVNLKLYIVALLVFLLNYLPLIIFNARHENILFKSLTNFANYYSPDLSFIERFVFVTKSIAFPFYSYYLFHSSAPIFFAITILTITGGLYLLFKTGQKFLLIIPISILTTILGFTLYKGPIPDYYFLETLLPVTILVSIVVVRNVILLVTYLAILLFTNLQAAQNYNTIINYQVKKQAIDYIISDAQGRTFNVYYDLPMGFNTGYSYLFKAKGKVPQEGGDYLYILEFKDPKEVNLLKYQSAFSDKTVGIKSIGYLHVISAK